MARARNIKPGFFKNYDLADAGPHAQILFAGLWCLADREGRLEDKPRLIKAEIFPYYDCDVNGELTELERLGLVVRYEVDGALIIQVCNFKKHQTPHNTEKASTLPDQSAAKPRPATTSDNNGELTVDSRKSNGGKTPDSLIHRFTDSLIPDTQPKPKAAPKGDLFPGIDPDLVADFKAMRSKQNAPITKTVVKGIQREADKARISLADALTICCERGWRGFKAEWITQPRAGPTKPEKFDPLTYVNRNRTKAPDERTIDIDEHGEPILEMVRSSSQT